MEQIYHVSKFNLDNKILKPRIPSNLFTKNGYEDNETKRVCFSKTIKGAIMALGQNCDGCEIYVHTPITSTRFYTPNVMQVPDFKITKEVWVLNKDVQIKCIGKIHVFNKGKDPIYFGYKDMVTSIYEYEYKWIEKY